MYVRPENIEVNCNYHPRQSIPLRHPVCSHPVRRLVSRAANVWWRSPPHGWEPRSILSSWDTTVKWFSRWKPVEMSARENAIMRKGNGPARLFLRGCFLPSSGIYPGALLFSSHAATKAFPRNKCPRAMGNFFFPFFSITNVFSVRVAADFRAKSPRSRTSGYTRCLGKTGRAEGRRGMF
jgi:hypothetical protein